METLHSLAYNALGKLHLESGFSVFQLLCLEGDIEILQLVLNICPNVVDLVMLLKNPVQNHIDGTQNYLMDILKASDTEHHSRVLNLLQLHSKGLENEHLSHVVARDGTVHHIRKVITHSSLPQQILLNYAAEYNTLDVVKELLCKGLSLCPAYTPNLKPIHFAARAGRNEIVEYMLKANRELINSIGDGFSPLHMTVLGGHIDTATVLIQHGADVNNGYKTGTTTPLMLAAARGHVELFEVLEKYNAVVNTDILKSAVEGGSYSLVKKLAAKGLHFKSKEVELLHSVNSPDVAEFLLNLGLDVMATEKNGETPLHAAIRKRNVCVADVFIKYGAVVGSFEDIRSPLHELFNRNDKELREKPNVEMISYFLKKATSSQLTENDIYSGTLLHHTDICGPEVTRILIQSGLDVNAVGTEEQCTPLHIAVRGCLDTVKVLIEYGADAYAVDMDGRTPLHYAVCHMNEEIVRFLLTVDINLVHAVDENGQNPLHAFALFISTFCCEEKTCVEILLEFGCDLLRPDIRGNTPLHYFFAFSSESQTSLLNLLVDHVTTNQSSCALKAVNNKGRNVLHYAARCANAFVVNYLLQIGFELDTVDNQGESVLHLAVKYQDYNETLELFLNKGADVNIIDVKGNSLLHKAAATNLRPMEGTPANVIHHLDILLNWGIVHVNSKNKNGEIPLHIFLKSSRYSFTDYDYDELLLLLLRKGSHINAANNEGVTPLHLSVCYGHISEVEILLNRGANVNVADCSGNTPLHVAAHYPDALDIYEMLIEHGADTSSHNKNGETPISLRLQNPENRSYGDLRCASPYGRTLSIDSCDSLT